MLHDLRGLRATCYQTIRRLSTLHLAGGHHAVSRQNLKSCERASHLQLVAFKEPAAGQYGRGPSLLKRISSSNSTVGIPPVLLCAI